MKNLLPALCLASLVACSSVPSAPDVTEEETLPFVGDLTVERFRLRNGLRVLFVRDSSSPTFAYHTWFGVGSKDEEEGKTGLAHFFEHMMFKRTKSTQDGEFMKTLERAGARGLNAFTGQDYTAYIVQLPKERFELVAKLEADRMRNLVIDDEGFRTEREVVKNERRYRTENSPDGTMYEELDRLAFKKHPYHWPVIGWEKDLDAMGPPDGREFYDRYYQPSNATIVIVGDLELADVRRTLRAQYGAIPAGEVKRRAFQFDAEPKSPRRKRLSLSLSVPKLLVAYPIPGISDAESPAFEMMQAVLSDGRSSRLRRALIDTGLASDVMSGSFGTEHPGLFLFSVTLQKGRPVAEAERVLLEEIARLAKSPPTVGEWERAKNYTRFQFYNAFEGSMGKARYLGKTETVLGDFRRGLELFERTDAFKREDLPKKVARWLAPHRRIVIEGMPK